MHNAWQVIILNFFGQVSPNGPHTLLLLLPPFISPSLLFPRTPLLSPHYPIPIYILHQLFIPFQCPHSYCILGLPHVCFFGLFLAISSPCPCLPPCPHFRFFVRFLDASLHVFLSHFLYTCTYMIISIE